MEAGHGSFRARNTEVFRLLPLVFLIPLGALAQLMSLGVTGAVPISPHSATYPEAQLGISPSIQAKNDLYSKPYAVGAQAEFFLPLNISLEAGLLYQRFHQDISAGITPIRGGPVNFGYSQSLAANAFLFPLLAKYSFGNKRLRPFIHTGATLRHLDTFVGNGIQLDFYLHPSPAKFQFDPQKSIDVAITAGVGVRYRLAIFDIAPEIRYLHWTAAYEQPVKDQALLMVTISFPSKK